MCRDDGRSSAGLRIRHGPSAKLVVAVFAVRRGWITPSSEMCSMILIFLMLSLHLLDEREGYSVQVHGALTRIRLNLAIYFLPLRGESD